MSIFEKLFGKSKKEAVKSEIDKTVFSLHKKPNFQNFNDLLNHHAGLSFEKQQNFSELTKGLSWNINLDRGTLSFGNIDFPIAVIGSMSFNDYSWMWAWANDKSGIPKKLLGNALKLKEIGEKRQIEEFTNGHFNAGEGFEYKMGLIAIGLLNADAYFCANYEQGTMLVSLTSNRIPKINNNGIQQVLTTFPKLIKGIDLNHEQAFQNYLIDRSIKFKIEDNQIEGRKNGKVLTAEFDDLNRLKTLNGKL